MTHSYLRFALVRSECLEAVWFVECWLECSTSDTRKKDFDFFYFPAETGSNVAWLEMNSSWEKGNDSTRVFPGVRRTRWVWTYTDITFHLLCSKADSK